MKERISWMRMDVDWYWLTVNMSHFHFSSFLTYFIFLHFLSSLSSFIHPLFVAGMIHTNDAEYELHDNSIWNPLSFFLSFFSLLQLSTLNCCYNWNHNHHRHLFIPSYLDIIRILLFLYRILLLPFLSHSVPFFHFPSLLHVVVSIIIIINISTS